MTLKVQVALGLKWQVISIAGRQLLSLVVFTTLARSLNPSDFGLAALVAVYLGFVLMFIDQGIGVAIIQRQDLEPEHLDTAFWFNIGCAFILCLGTILFAGEVAALYREPRLAPLLRWSSVGLVIGASSAIHSTLFVRAMNFRQPVLRGLIANIAGGAVGIGMALNGFGVWSLVGQQLAGETAAAIFLWSMSPFRPSMRFSLPHLRQLFGFSSSVFVTSVIWSFAIRIDQIVIGRFAGIASLGLYAIAAKIPNVATMAAQEPMANVSLPTLSRLQNDHARMREVISRGLELGAVISFAVFVGLAAVSSTLVPLLFGPKWAGAAVLCALLSIYALVGTIGVFFYPAILATGGVGNAVWLNVVHVIGVAVACLVGIQFGVTSLVVGLILNGMVTSIPGLIFLRGRIGMSPLDYGKPCLAPAIASVFMFGMVRLIPILLPQSIWLAWVLALEITAGAATYLGFLFLFRRQTLFRLIEMAGHSFGYSFRTIATLPPLIEE